MDDALIGMEAPPRTTSKIPLPEACAIRKSPHGRAILAIENVSYQELRCSSSITQHVRVSSLFHAHVTSTRLPDAWSTPTDLACWHCCHGFDGCPVPVPRSYDTRERRYVVAGNFCSLRCAKGYLLDNPSFESQQHVNMFTRMARDVYGESDVPAAPPRVCLQMFGGPHTLAHFRDGARGSVILSPPFITSYMVVDEREASVGGTASAYAVNSSSGVRGLRRPVASMSMVAATAPVALGDVPYVQFAHSKHDASHAPIGGAAVAEESAPAPSATRTPGPPPSKPTETEAAAEAEAGGGAGAGVAIAAVGGGAVNCAARQRHVTMGGGTTGDGAPSRNGAPPGGGTLMAFML